MAVPGIGTKASTDWTDEAGNLWLTDIQAPGIGLYAYDHNISNLDTALWQRLLDHGQELLRSIIRLVDSQHVIKVHRY